MHNSSLNASRIVINWNFKFELIEKLFSESSGKAFKACYKVLE